MTRVRRTDAWRVVVTQARSRTVRLLNRTIGHERLRAGRGRWFLRPADRLLRSGQLWALGGIVPHLRFAAAHFDYDGSTAFGVITGQHEVSVQEALRRTVPRGGVVLDLGAGFGVFSLIAAALAGPEGRVVAVDPLARNVEAIRAHAAANGFATIDVIAAAAGAASGQIELVETDDAMWGLLASVGEHPHPVARRTVPLVSVDALVADGRIPEPDVIKIDVEGSELDVLEGMRALVGRRHPILIVEMHDRNAAFAALASSLGYALENLEGPEPVAAAGPNIHVLCRPPQGADGIAQAASR